MPITSQDFVSQCERQPVHDHFIDRRSRAGHETPMQSDPKGKHAGHEKAALNLARPEG